MPVIASPDAAKRLAAERAVALVPSGARLGLGTGSTMRFALEALARRLADGSLAGLIGIPTSEQTAQIASHLGIPLASLDTHLPLDLAIDGADEIDPSLDLIKGHGGALLREKIVAASAREVVIIADASKIVTRLGTRCAVPIEVVPFALALVLDRLRALAGRCEPRVGPDGEAFRTDEGNWIVDLHVGPIADAAALDHTLRRIPGVVDHGLFLGLATRAIVADESGRVRVLDRRRR